MHRGIEGIDGELSTQREILKDREPSYARLLEQLADAVRGPFGESLERAWAARDFHAFYERPLLLLAALRYDALCEGPLHPLYAALTEDPRVEAATPEALARSLAEERIRFHQALRTRTVQTNETSRAVAWLWPAALLARAGEQRALALVDLGTSAGLNLIADRLPAPWTNALGEPLAVEPRLSAGLRIGLDLAPLDVRTSDAAQWLRACVWPSDQHRLARLEAGVAAFIASAAEVDAPSLRACSLADARPHLDALPAEMLVLCVQTIVRDYLPAAVREEHERSMRDFLATRAPRSALWMELELDPNGETIERAAALSAHFVDAHGAARDLVLARTHPHPAQLYGDTDAVEAFVSAFAG